MSTQRDALAEAIDKAWQNDRSIIEWQRHD
jgi:hypothetical protein